ncbi:MAG: flagellar biosynthesis anti-sigma factor FlgM [Dehalococcoidia bacterium]|nr:flagellar biosynthesis anti-sigma factor FlgM [Dehalococcoidia bacterium]
MTRIDGLNPLITGNTQRGQASTGIDGADGSGGHAQGASGRQDVIALSDRGKIVALAARAVSQSRDARQERVLALRAAIANGTYTTNARDIAARLLANGFGAD